MIRELETEGDGIVTSCRECGEQIKLGVVVLLPRLREVQTAHALCVPQSVRLDAMKEAR